MATGTLLVADDEPAVLQLGRRMLERLGYTVLMAKDGQEAVDIFRAHPDDISCVVLDLTMPRLDGAGACKAIRAIRPGVPVVIASGYGQDSESGRFGPEAVSAFIQKPFRLDTLRSVLESVLAPH